MCLAHRLTRTIEEITMSLLYLMLFYVSGVPRGDGGGGMCSGTPHHHVYHHFLAIYLLQVSICQNSLTFSRIQGEFFLFVLY